MTQSTLGRNELARLRLSMRAYPTFEEVDAVVIGTGAGGAPILAKLASAGLRVVGLEAGPWFGSPAEQFATGEIAAAQIYWLVSASPRAARRRFLAATRPGPASGAQRFIVERLPRVPMSATGACAR